MLRSVKKVLQLNIYNYSTLNGNKILDFYSQFQPSPLSIKQFIDFGRSANEEVSFQFLRKEIPVRLANILKEIHLLPESLLQTPSVSLVYSWYFQSLYDIVEFKDIKPITKELLAKFCNTLIEIRNRHSEVVPTMAQGIKEMKESYPVDQQLESSIQYFLDRFYMSRISIPLLFNRDPKKTHHHIGCIDPECNIVHVAHDAYDDARFLCDQYYLSCPELVIQQVNEMQKNIPIRIVYVPSHLYHILFEIFKNSMRAVIERYGTECDDFPAIHILVVKGKTDVTIKGGGIPHCQAEVLFQYLYSTVPTPSKVTAGNTTFAGLGYGLPISRLYARYFQGDLIISPVEGYGMDAFIYLKALSGDANECLPIFGKSSTQLYKADIKGPTWSTGKQK